MKSSSWVLLTMFALVATGAAASTNEPEKPEFSAYVDVEGNISLPADFRARMVQLGSWFVPDGEASGFHDVYSQPGSVEHFRKTGTFPDGAMLIKELRASKSGDYTTGNRVHHATSELKQWSVMVKDSGDRLPDSGL